MNEKNLNLMIENKDFLNKKIDYYFNKNILLKSISKYEIKGHLDKSRHNLSFLNEIKPKFNDWFLVVCYYAAYHAALALILCKGYYSKNHDATICILIKEFYKKELTKEEIKLLNLFDTQDILFYAESKNKREEANYSTKIKFNLNDVKNIKLKTNLFVNKVENIIKDNIV
jgi:uncharacterized protein (UPF0332 family)